MSCRIYHISWLILILLCLHQDVICVEWVEKPAETSVVKGSNARINCVYTGYSMATWSGPGGTLFVNNISMTTDPRFTITQIFNLNIANVRESDQGYYTCTVRELSAERAYLHVHTFPHDTIININDTRQEKIEGDVISLTCSSIGNPPPEITWYRENTQLTNTDEVQIIRLPDEGHGAIETKSTSQLVVKLQYTDDKLNFYCYAKNTVNQNNPVQMAHLVSVQFAPRVTLEQSPFNIILGTTKQLRCIVKANPSVSQVEWQKDGAILSNTGVELPLTNVERSSSGSYRCTARNIVNGQQNSDSKTVQVNVIYAPIISVPSTKIVNETSELNIRCVVDSNPPALSIKWSKLDGSLESSSEYFRVSPVTKQYAGNYSCIVVYRLEPYQQTAIQDQKTAYTYVHIQYAPGVSSLTAVSNQISIGQTLTLRCSTLHPGYPDPQYEWKKVDTNEILNFHGSTLTIQTAKLKDNGEYSCTPYNIMGRGGMSSVSVVVREPPQFEEFPPTSQTILSNQSSFNLLCKIRGLPAPSIQWLRNGQLIQNGPLYTITSDITSVEQYSKLVTTRLKFTGSERHGLKIEDIGNYSCRETSTGDQHVVELFILFKPHIESEEKVATTANQTTVLTCRGQGYPIPKFDWYRDQTIIVTDAKYTVHATNALSVTEASSSLTVRNVVASDFGQYVCILQNDNGSAHKKITLTVKNRPEAPHNLSVISYTWESVYIRWSPGFDGGEPQSFFIYYTSSSPPIYTKDIQVLPGDATHFNVSDLMPGVAYQFQVYGKNSLGTGNYSKKIIIQTKDFAFPVINVKPKYTTEDKKLVIPFTLNTTYCVKVKVSVNGGAIWRTILVNRRECFTATEETREVSLLDEGVNRVNVSLCLAVRQDVCGVHLSASIRQAQKADLTETEVIIIGVVCAIILLSLIIVLIVIICRRRTNAKEYGSSNSTNRQIISSPVNGNATGPPKPLRAVQDNQGIDLFWPVSSSVVGSHGDSHCSNTWCCAPDNGPPPNYRSVVSNGSIPLDTSYDSQLAKYENEMNMRNMHNLKNEAFFGNHNGSPSTPRKDPHHFLNTSDERKDENFLKSGQESGYSTPEGQQKPKKVIYEVVV